jgi:hypothetical protein
LLPLSARHKIEHALAGAQRNWLAKLCRERGPFAAVQLADGAISTAAFASAVAQVQAGPMIVPNTLKLLVYGQAESAKP